MKRLTDAQISILKTTETNDSGYYRGSSKAMRQLVEKGLMLEVGETFFKLAPDWRQQIIDQDIEMI